MCVIEDSGIDYKILWSGRVENKYFEALEYTEFLLKKDKRVPRLYFLPYKLYRN